MLLKMTLFTLLTILFVMMGCEQNDNRRLAEMAERNLDRQNEQAREHAQLHRDVTEGTKTLVEENAKVRQEMIGYQRDVQEASSQLDRQRDQLDEERKTISSQRRRDPIIAEAIKDVGVLIACLLPLLVALSLLRQRVDPAADDTAITEFFISEISRADSFLIADESAPPRLPSHSSDAPRLEDNEDSTDES